MWRNPVESWAPLGSCGWSGGEWPGIQNHYYDDRGNLITTDYNKSVIQNDFEQASIWINKAITRAATSTGVDANTINVPVLLGEFGSIQEYECIDELVSTANPPTMETTIMYKRLLGRPGKTQQDAAADYAKIYNAHVKAANVRVAQRAAWTNAVREVAEEKNFAWTVFDINGQIGFGIIDVWKTFGRWVNGQMMYNAYGWKLLEALRPTDRKTVVNNGDVDRNGRFTNADALMAEHLANIDDGIYEKYFNGAESTSARLATSTTDRLHCPSLYWKPSPRAGAPGVCTAWDRVKNANAWRADVDGDGTVKYIDALALLSAATETTTPNMANYALRVPLLNILSTGGEVVVDVIAGEKGSRLMPSAGDEQKVVVLLTAKPAWNFKLPDSNVWTGVTCERNTEVLSGYLGAFHDYSKQQYCVIRNVPYRTGSSKQITANFVKVWPDGTIPEPTTSSAGSRSANKIPLAFATIVLLGGVPLGVYYLVKRRNRVSVDAAPPTVQ